MIMNSMLILVICLLQQEISQAMDAAIRKYNETTPEKDKTPKGLVHAMRAGANEKTGKLNVKMMKLVTVANPAHKPEFLAEVSLIHTFSLDVYNTILSSNNNLHCGCS
jgi:hypothetical protein